MEHQYTENSTIFFKLKSFYVCPRRRLLPFVLASIDIAGGTNLATQGLLNSRVKRREE